MAHKTLLKVLRDNLKRALHRGGLEEAKALLARLHDEDPLALATRGLELEYLIAAGSWEEATHLAQQLIQLFPVSARIQYLTGRVCYHQKDYMKARSHFDESQRLHPHWLPRHWLAKTHTQLGNYALAEALLVDLQPNHPRVALDLAWLFERRGVQERALKVIENYLQQDPGDVQAQRQRLRLKSNSLAPAELLAEVEVLMELGETVPAEMLSAYIQRLFETGQGASARRFIQENYCQWKAHTVASIAWICHRVQAYDVALQLFLAELPGHARDYKYLSALESAALHCQRIEPVLSAYEVLAPENKPLYGRMKSLNRRQPKDSDP